MAVTIKDVAQHAGLSIGAVSQVLNGTGQLSDETRDRVLRAVRELGYRPNLSARAIRRGCFNAVALLTSTDARLSYLPRPLLDGIVGEVERHEMHLVMASLPNEKLTSRGYVPQILREYMSDGLLINYQYEIPQEMSALIEQYRIPSVWINSKRPTDGVYLDEYGASRRAGQMLLGLGHRRIGYVDYSASRDELAKAHYSVIDRQAGCEDVLREANVPLRVFRGERHVRGPSRLDFTRRWMRDPDRPTAVVCYAAGSATQIAIAAAELGLSIPRDLSIIAFDAVGSAEVGLALTIFRLLLSRMGQAAVRMLVDKLAEPDREPPSQAIAHELVEGESVAAPPRV
jgi:LacI family transcriptional regulator